MQIHSHNTTSLKINDLFKQAREGSLNEIIISQDSALQPALLLTLLTKMSVDERWLMWISNQESIHRAWINHLGVDTNRVLHLRPTKNMLNLAIRALEVGTGHAIIEWTGELLDYDFKVLQAAAYKGKTHALIIRYR
jgi:cell division inhibitor SulA